MSNKSIEVKNLSKTYNLGNYGFKSLRYNLLSNYIKNMINPNKKIYALYDINLEINKGEAIAILGKNGTGKSTLLKIISGLSEQSSGEILKLPQQFTEIAVD